jgi:hypothetical protein
MAINAAAIKSPSAALDIEKTEQIEADTQIASLLTNNESANTAMDEQAA